MVALPEEGITCRRYGVNHSINNGLLNKLKYSSSRTKYIHAMFRIIDWGVR